MHYPMGESEFTWFRVNIFHYQDNALKPSMHLLERWKEAFRNWLLHWATTSTVNNSWTAAFGDCFKGHRTHRRHRVHSIVLITTITVNLPDLNQPQRNDDLAQKLGSSKGERFVHSVFGFNGNHAIDLPVRFLPGFHQGSPRMHVSTLFRRWGELHSSTGNSRLHRRGPADESLPKSSTSVNATRNRYFVLRITLIYFAPTSLGI